jgi:cytochrome c553
VHPPKELKVTEPDDRARPRAAMPAAASMLALRVGALVGLLLGALAAGAAAAQDAPAATATCAACHGDDGNSAIPMFPKIAGLQESYIVKQLRDFQSGRRRSDVMAPVMAALKPQDIAPLAAYYSRQALKPGQPGDKKVADVGKLLFYDGNEETGVPACLGCHQPQGRGHLIYPRIGGQHVEYVKQQLKNFASGDRANDPSRFMRTVAKRLSDEEINAVAAYLVGLDSK